MRIRINIKTENKLNCQLLDIFYGDYGEIIEYKGHFYYAKDNLVYLGIMILDSRFQSNTGESQPRLTLFLWDMLLEMLDIDFAEKNYGFVVGSSDIKLH